MIARTQRKTPSSASSTTWAVLAAVAAIVLLLDVGVVCADDKNITRLLNNQAIVNRQIMCVLEKSPCDQLGRQLKGAHTTETARTQNTHMINYKCI